MRPIIIAIADDFSGAAEIAGIGHAYGMKTSIQTKVNGADLSEFSIFCTNSREKSAPEAIEILGSLLDAIMPFLSDAFFFKKIDSVFRGHILVEDQIVKSKCNLQRSFLLAANPSKNRIIRDGIYYVEGIPLDQTAFAWDPLFPRSTSKIRELLDKNIQVIGRKRPVPVSGTLVFDQETTADLDGIMESVRRDRDLVCGGGDAFIAFLNSLPITKKDTGLRSWKPKGNTLFVDGSTSPLQIHLPADLPVVYLGMRINDLFLKELSFEDLAIEVLQKLQEKADLYLKVGVFEPENEIDGKEIEKILGKLVKVVLLQTERQLDLCLTGGATAMAVVIELGFTSFGVDDQLSAGVVALNVSGSPLRIIVKPGSYLWPNKLVKN